MLECHISHDIAGKTILNEIAFSVETGKHLLLLGPSGCGKTTLLSIVSGLQQPSSGTVHYQQQDLYALSPRKRDELRGKHVGIVFQELHLIDALSVADNLKIAENDASDEAAAYRQSLLERLGLADKQHLSTSKLSRGERQRLAIARALINKPSILFADEPTSALDDTNAANVLGLLQHHAEQANASLVITTHDQRVKDICRFDTVIELQGEQA